MQRETPLLTQAEIESLSSRLFDSEQHASPTHPPSEEHPGLTVADAYAVQRDLVGQRGTHRLGHKIGCTNARVQQQFGVHEPDFGVILEDMVVPDGGEIDPGRLIQPRIEPEIAFLLARDVIGPGATALSVLHATAAVVPSLEIIDSRIVDWRIRLVDTIADNASSARVVLGWHLTRPSDVDLRCAGSVLERNGRVVATGAGAAVLGHPAASVAALANALAEHEDRLRAGDFVLSGALTEAFDIGPREVWYADFGALGCVRCSFTGGGNV